MLEIYRHSLRYFVTSLPALLAFAAIIEGLFWLLQPRSEAGVSLAALTIIAYYFHRHFLFGEQLSLARPNPQAGTPPAKIGWFMLISFALGSTPLGISLILALAFMDQVHEGTFLLIGLLAYLMTLSLFGTTLPASVAKDGSYRVSQGLGVTFQTMWRLVAGPGVTGFLLIIIAIPVAHGVAALEIQTDSLLMLALNIRVRTLGFLTTILAVAVLCRMYRITRPPGAELLPGGQIPA